MNLFRYLMPSDTMTVTLTPKLEQLVQELVASGRFNDERAVIRAELRARLALRKRKAE